MIAAKRHATGRAAAIRRALFEQCATSRTLAGAIDGVHVKVYHVHAASLGLYDPDAQGVNGFS